MKTLKFLTLCAVSALLMASCCNNTVGERLPGIEKGQMDSVSYAVGMSFGNMIKQSNMDGINFAEINKAMKDVLSGAEPQFKEEEVGRIIQTYMMEAEKAMSVIKEQEQAEFLAENKTKDSVQVTESGLQYKIVNPGNTEVMAVAEDTVEVHYTGKLLDGTVFDSSITRGEAIKFPLNAVIKGWTEGMQLVGEGGKIVLWVPYELGYGSRSMGPKLPAYSTLVFDVEVLKVCKAAPKEEKSNK